MTRTEVIQAVIDKIKAKYYLEIGVFAGENFRSIKALRKTAVDPEFKLSRSKMWKSFYKYHFTNLFERYLEITSDRYFEKYKRKLLRRGIDVCFIDGLHTYEQSLKDVLNSLEYLNEGGVIIMHDCLPPNKAAATPANSLEEVLAQNLEGFTNEWCGDTFKSIVHLRAQVSSVNAFVLDTDYGLGIVVKGEPSQSLKLDENKINSLTFDDIERDKETLLGLKPVSYFSEFLASLKAIR